MGKADGSLSWDLAEVAKALKISPEAVREYFTDGRRVSFILERRIAKEVLSATLAKSEGAGYDLVDSSGAKWEVRSISDGGVHFYPSYMVGSQRSFDEPGFLAKPKEIKDYNQNRDVVDKRAFQQGFLAETRDGDIFIGSCSRGLFHNSEP
jgi:hypothetical protein